MKTYRAEGGKSALVGLRPEAPLFIAVAAGALFLAWRLIWRPAIACAPGEVCALPQAKRSYKVIFVAVALLVLLALAFPYVAPWFY
jgi:mercuric ion transport protein